MMEEKRLEALIVDCGRMRYLRGRWFLLWCVAALLAGLVLGLVWREP
jgi:hypothetical protein